MKTQKLLISLYVVKIYIETLTSGLFKSTSVRINFCYFDSILLNFFCFNSVIANKHKKFNSNLEKSKYLRGK